MLFYYIWGSSISKFAHLSASRLFWLKPLPYSLIVLALNKKKERLVPLAAADFAIVVTKISQSVLFKSSFSINEKSRFLFDPKPGTRLGASVQNTSWIIPGNSSCLFLF